MRLTLYPDKIDAPNRISPSGLKTFQDCPRKYQHKYKLKTKPDPVKRDRSGGARFGKKVHKVLEDFVSGQMRLIPEEDPVEILAAAMYDGTKGLAEVPFALVGPDLWFYGIIDVLMPDGFTDWKTSSDPNQYAITRKQMKTDPQNVIYSLVALTENGGTSTKSRYVYGSSKTLTRGPKRETITERHEVVEQFELIYAQAFEAVHGNEYPQDRTHCEMYGGCPYKSQCPMSGSEFLAS